jgi:hypothetical protein
MISTMPQSMPAFQSYSRVMNCVVSVAYPAAYVILMTYIIYGAHCCMVICKAFAGTISCHLDLFFYSNHTVLLKFTQW